MLVHALDLKGRVLLDGPFINLALFVLAVVRRGGPIVVLDFEHLGIAQILEKCAVLPLFHTLLMSLSARNGIFFPLFRWQKERIDLLHRLLPWRAFLRLLL